MIKNIYLLLKSIYFLLQELVDLHKQIQIGQKEDLTFQETLTYFGFKKDHLYRLTKDKEIPLNKPGGKLIWFNRQEVSDWIRAGRVKTASEINDEIESKGKEARKNGK